MDFSNLTSEQVLGGINLAGDIFQTIKGPKEVGPGITLPPGYFPASGNSNTEPPKNATAIYLAISAIVVIAITLILLKN